LLSGLRRMWLPLLVVAVVVVGGFLAYRIRVQPEASGPLRSNDAGAAKDAKPFNPKVLRYEVFGSPGSVADLNYFDQDAQPIRVDAVRLPWSFTIVSTLTALTGNIVAQGDGSQIGCRIIVDGQVKDQRSATEHDAYTFCIVKSA
jgi:hypothetical protein